MHEAGRHALDELLEGNRRFRSGTPRRGSYSPQDLSDLARGQHPIAAVVTCSDSRVCPEVFLDQGLGRLFVSRVPGNVASDGAKWMIEIAVSEFKVPLLAVIGHTGCLAVSQVVQGETGGSGALLKIGILSSMYEASAKHPEDIGRATVIENARHTIRQLATESHTLRQALHANAITCVAMLYNMDEGSVALIDEPLSNPL